VTSWKDAEQRSNKNMGERTHTGVTARDIP
jgi:hypothetical protein